MEKEEFSFCDRKDEGERDEGDLASYQDVVVHSPPYRHSSPVSTVVVCPPSNINREIS
ncbi:unnamed protein product, partial [Musa acuminata subsp. burmannicoides]